MRNYPNKYKRKDVKINILWNLTLAVKQMLLNLKKLQ